MIISLINTISSLTRKGVSVVRENLQMWLGFNKSEVIGKELVTNGDFSDGITGWSVAYPNTTLSINDDELRATANSSGAYGVSQELSLNNGSTYQVVATINVDSASGGTANLRVATNSNLSVGAITLYQSTGTITTTFVATSSTMYIGIADTANDSNNYVEIDNIIVKEVSQFVKDKSTNSNDAKLFTGKALSFDGVNDYVDIGNGINPQSGVWTFMATVKSTDTTTSVSGANPIFSRDNYFVVFGIDGGQLSASYHNGGWIKQTFSSDVVSDGSYNRIAYEYDVTNQTCKGYLNGVFLSSITFNPSLVLDFNRIGKATTFLNGTLSNLQIWQGDLEQGDYTFDYNNPNHLVTDNPNTTLTLSNLSAYYALSEGSGSIAYDSSGGGNNGTITGATYDDQQPTIPQLGMVDWSKGSNLIPFSEDFSDSIWLKSSATLSSGETSPIGDSSAFKVTSTAGLLYISNIDLGNQGNMRSIWAKTVSGTGTVYLASHNTDASGLFTVTNEWQRFNIIASSVANNFYAIDFRGSATLTEVIVWGAQLSGDTTLGSYIGTNGSAASNATLVQNPNDKGKDVLGNSLRLREHAFNLDGSGYAEVADDDSLDFGTGDFSIEAWVKYKYVNTNSSYNVVSTLGGSFPNNTSAAIVSDSTQLRFYVGSSHVDSTTTLVEGQWYYIVGTRTGSTLRMYVDKIAEGGTSSSSLSVTNTDTKRIGGDNTLDRPYQDLIDDVRIYNRALTQKEITQNYKAGINKHKVGSSFSDDFSSDYGL